MKKTVFPYLIAILLFSSLAILPLTFAQSNFDAFSGSTISDAQIDGVIGSEWDDSGKYSGVSINPTGTAEVWIKHNETDLFLAVRFSADSSNPWVAFQFSSSGCMTATNDGALFGHDGHEPNGYRDISFGGVGAITADSVQNGRGAMNIDSFNVVIVELKKPLNSGDSTGNDISWSTGNTYVMVIMWDSNGGGSSGGSANHMSASIVSNNVFLNTDAIPEISSIIVVAFLVASMVCLVIFKAKTSHKKL